MVDIVRSRRERRNAGREAMLAVCECFWGKQKELDDVGDGIGALDAM